MFGRPQAISFLGVLHLKYSAVLVQVALGQSWDVLPCSDRLNLRLLAAEWGGDLPGLPMPRGAGVAPSGMRHQVEPREGRRYVRHLQVAGERPASAIWRPAIAAVALCQFQGSGRSTSVAPCSEHHLHATSAVAGTTSEAKVSPADHLNSCHYRWPTCRPHRLVPPHPPAAAMWRSPSR